MEDSKLDPNSFHLAGIIPVAGAEDEFGFDWHGIFIPIAPNFNALEKSLVECAYMGCETIWIVCNDDVAPLIKHRIGDYIQDIDSVARGKHVKFSSEKHLTIPIYYVPIHPKHRDKIDCYPWSILHGANVAYWMCRRLSRWVIPDKYYVSFPYGVYDPAEAKSHRASLRTKNSFYLSHEGKTICDGELLGFTFDSSEWRRARDIIKKNSKVYFPPLPGDTMPSIKLPKEKQLESRNYYLQEVFGGASPKASEIFDLKWYYNLTTWRGYCKLLSSTHASTITRPDKVVLNAGRLKPIGEPHDRCE